MTGRQIVHALGALKLRGKGYAPFRSVAVESALEDIANRLVEAGAGSEALELLRTLLVAIRDEPEEVNWEVPS